MVKPSDYFKKLDLAHLDANTAQFIREKILTLPNIDILERTKEFETIKAIVEENFPRAIGIEPVVIAPIVEEIPEPIIEAVVEPIIDTKQEEIKTISGEISEMTDLVDLLNEVVAENPQDLDSMDVLELYKETLVELSNKLKSLTEVITEAVSEVKDNIEEVKEVIKTDVVDTKGILTAPKKYKTEDSEEVLGYESDWNFGTKKHLGETVVYYVYKEGSEKYSVLTGILHKGEIIYSEDKISNKEFENKFDSEKEALDFAYDISLDKDSIDKYEKGGNISDVKGKFLAQISVPYNFEHVVKNEYDFINFLSKSLTKKWFGYGVWDVKIISGLDDKNNIIVEIEIPYRILNEYDLTQFISKSLTKKWFGNGIWGVKIIGSYLGKYVAVHESKDGYWTIASKPTSKENAEAMLGGTPKNEVGKVVTLEEAKAHKKTVGEEYLYEKGGSVKSFNPEFLIGYGFLGNVESSTIIGFKETSKDNIKLERKSNVGELKYESSFTLKELKDLYSGKKVGQYEAFKPVMENGGEIDEIRSGAVVKWKGKDGVYDVIGTYEGNVTLREINPDPERDYKGSYNADIKDLELVQKSNTPKDSISEYDKVLYKDTYGDYTKTGVVEKIYRQDGVILYAVRGTDKDSRLASYMRDEIKKIK